MNRPLIGGQVWFAAEFVLPCHSVGVNQMNPLTRAVGLVLLMIGGFWFFMGIGVIDGSVLSNNPLGTGLGVLFLAGGAIVLWRGWVPNGGRTGGEAPSASTDDAPGARRSDSADGSSA